MECLTLGRNDQFKSFIYRNLHQACWSVKALEGPNKGRVVFHAQYVAVAGGCNRPEFPQRDQIQFKVSEAGRQRVLKEKRKNVHAGIVGYPYHAVDVNIRYPDAIPEREVFTVDGDASNEEILPNPLAYREVAYNPYKFDQFVFADNHKPAGITDENDQDVLLDPTGKVYVMSIKNLGPAL